jgi:hypothetical protein
MAVGTSHSPTIEKRMVADCLFAASLVAETSSRFAILIVLRGNLNCFAQQSKLLCSAIQFTLHAKKTARATLKHGADHPKRLVWQAAKKGSANKRRRNGHAFLLRL